VDIDVSKSFVLYAKSEIKYDGRATSILDIGNYLIIYKDDGSILIHGGNKIQPKNYQGSKSKIHISDNKIISTRKSETITIIIHNIINVFYPEEWSHKGIKITKTEKDLVDKIIKNIDNLLDRNIDSVETEYPTDAGPIDIIAWDYYGMAHVIEVKRGKANINACSQVRRYVEYIDNGKTYIASPKISKNALNYCKKHGIKWLEIDHD